jgi:hypothetical protein
MIDLTQRFIWETRRRRTRMLKQRGVRTLEKSRAVRAIYGPQQSPKAVEATIGIKTPIDKKAEQKDERRATAEARSKPATQTPASANADMFKKVTGASPK